MSRSPPSSSFRRNGLPATSSLRNDTTVSRAGASGGRSNSSSNSAPSRSAHCRSSMEMTSRRRSAIRTRSSRNTSNARRLNRNGLGDRRFPLATGLGDGRNPQHHREQSRQRDDVVRQHALGRRLRQRHHVAGQAVDDAVERLVRHGLVLVAAPGEHDDVVACRQAAEKGPHQRALADARRTAHVHGRRAAACDRQVCFVEHLELTCAADERRVRERLRCRLRTPTHASGPQPSLLSASRPDSRRAGSRHIRPMQIDAEIGRHFRRELRGRRRIALLSCAGARRAADRGTGTSPVSAS